MAQYTINFSTNASKAAAEIQRVQNELTKVIKIGSGVTLSLDTASFSKSINATFGALNKEIDGIQAKLSKLNIEGSINKANKRPLSLGQRASAAGGAVLYGGGLRGGAGSALGGIAGGLAGGVPGAFAGAAIGQTVDSLGQYAAAIARVVAEVNKSKIALAGVTRDVKDYDKAINAVTQASQNFLLPISQATGQFTKLQASVVGAGFSTETTIKTFNGIAAAVIATGGSTEDLNSALRATAQVFSKGKVSAEELRQQIGERVPGAFTIFAQSLNKTPEELDKALQDGKVTLNDFIKFVEELAKRYGTTAEILSKAPENAGPRLAVALEQASLTFGSFFQRVGAGFQGYISDLLDFTQQNQEQIKTVVASFVVLGQDIYNILSGVVEALAPVFNSFFGYIFENFAKGVNALARLAKEARGAAGGPEKRAAAAVEALYPNPLERALKGGQAYKEALAVELGYEKQAESRGTRLQNLKNTLFKDFKPTQFGAGLGKPSATGGGAGGGSGGNAGASSRGAKLGTYDQNQLAFIKAELEKEKQSLEQQRQQNLLSETAYKIAVAELELASAEKEAIEQLRVDKLAINRDNLSSADKLLKLKDAEISKENAIAIATKRRDIAVAGARKELEGPFNDAIDSANLSIAEQQVLLENVRNNIGELAPDQEAYLQVLRLTAGKNEDEVNLLKDKKEATRQVLEQQIALNNQIKKEQALRTLRGQLTAAKIFDPSLELRQKIRQENPFFTDADVEEEAVLQERVNQAQKLKEQLTGIASSISNSFGEAFKGIITGSLTAQEAFDGLFRSIAGAFADMVSQIIAEWARTQLIRGLQSIFGAVFPAFGGGIGGGIGAGLSSGFNAGTASAIDTSAAGFGAAFNTNLQFANGGIASGGFRAFANGGMVTGPTMGLVGEGRYNEAIIPLPDGKSVPVQLAGGAGGNAAPINTSIVVNVKNGQAESQMSGNQGNQLARELEGAVRQVILKESRPGGIIFGSR